MFFASALAMIVMSIVSILVLVGVVAGLASSLTEKDESKTKGDVLVIDLAKRIHEQGEVNSLASLSGGSDYAPGLYDITKAISYAKTDGAVKGILIKLSGTPNGWATLQQLRAALVDFKHSNKFIYAYGEGIPQAAYFVATAADSIYLNPAGDMDLKGFATILTFFKGTLDKLELEPEIFYAGKFKSATEPFRSDRMSEPNKIQVKAFQDGIWGQFLDAASDYTGVPRDTIHQWTLAGSIQFPADAKKAGLVADLLYWDEVEQRMRAKTGTKEGANIKYVTITDYAGAHKNDAKQSESRVAVLMAEGNIVDGEEDDEHQIASKNFTEAIRKVAKDDKIKAVVLRVNSPGGSALASEVILRELQLLKKKKPVIVSMGDYAASGGYYISTVADSIFALPNTITGSIGVFGMMFSLDKLAKNKLGVTFDGVKNAPYADVPTATRPLTPEEGQRVQASVDSIYALFKRHVAEGRNLPLADVDSIAQGRVWTGTDAQKIGLVDAMGGLDRAIASAAGTAKLKDYKVVTYPEASDKLEKLLKRFDNKSEAQAAIRAAIKEEAGPAYEWMGKLNDLRKMQGRAMMAMPWVPVVE